MRRSAIESLQRGVASLVANWQLVVAHVVQALIVTLLLIAGAVPFVLAVGIGTLRGLLASDFDLSGGAPAAAEDLLLMISETVGPLIIATLVASIVWTIAMIAYAYFQAGIYGVLAEADRQAPETAVGRADFRSFTASRFRAAADRGMWTFFWLINLFMLAGTVLVGAIGGIGLLVAWLAIRDRVGAAIGLGCLGGAVLALLVIAVGLWWQLAMASAASGPFGVWRATAASARILLRRAGGVLVLALLAVVVGMTAGIVFLPLGIFVEFVFGDSLSVYLAAQAVMSFIQSVFSAVLGVGFAGTFVALVAGEIPGERVSTP